MQKETARRSLLKTGDSGGVAAASGSLLPEPVQASGSRMLCTRNGTALFHPHTCMGSGKCKDLCPWKISERRSGAGSYLKALPIFAGNGVKNIGDRCFGPVQLGKLPASVEACPLEVKRLGPRQQIVKRVHRLSAERYRYISGETGNNGTNTTVSPNPFEVLNDTTGAGPGKPHLEIVSDSNRNVVRTIVLALMLAVFPQIVAAGTVLEGVKAHGKLRCGVSEGIPGFSERDVDGRWRGFEVDFCRAVAAAVLGNPEKVDFVPLHASTRFPALQSRKIDLLLRNTTWTLTREAVLKVQFPGILFYDGQGFMVAAAANIATPADLDGATICIEKGTTHRRNLEEYFRANSWSFEPLVINSASEAAQALFVGRCQAYTSDSSLLAAIRQLAPKNAQDFVILPERISKEPLGPVVWGGDPEWTTLVRWVLNILILAEEQGVTRDNLDAVISENRSPLVRRSTDEQEMIARSLGIPALWGARVLKAVGNYGEMYERNVGHDSPLNIERGLNRLWTQGGLHYAPPID